MENLSQDTKAELRVQISRMEWGETFPMHIRHFENLAALNEFVEETGLIVEVLEIIAYKITAPNSPHLGELQTRTLKQALRIKAAWKLNQGAHAVITDSDGYIISEEEQLKALIELLS